MLIYFGYPEAHEDDAERAVRAALAVIDAVGGLAPSERLNVRLGIASGLVVVGDLIGAGAAQERGVVGETPNLAAAGNKSPGGFLFDGCRDRNPPITNRSIEAGLTSPVVKAGISASCSARPASGKAVASESMYHGVRMRDLVADWKKWSRAERVLAVMGTLLIVGLLIVALPLGLLMTG